MTMSNSLEVNCTPEKASDLGREEIGKSIALLDIEGKVSKEGLRIVFTLVIRPVKWRSKKRLFGLLGRSASYYFASRGCDLRVGVNEGEVGRYTGPRDVDVQYQLLARENAKETKSAKAHGFGPGGRFGVEAGESSSRASGEESGYTYKGKEAELVAKKCSNQLVEWSLRMAPGSKVFADHLDCKEEFEFVVADAGRELTGDAEVYPDPPRLFGEDHREVKREYNISALLLLLDRVIENRSVLRDDHAMYNFELRQQG